MAYYTDNFNQIHRDVKDVMIRRLGTANDAVLLEMTSLIVEHLKKQENYILDKIEEKFSK